MASDAISEHSGSKCLQGFRITWLLNAEKGMCLWLPKRWEIFKIWFLFLLKTSQNEFHNCKKKPLHRYPWKHQLDCLLVIFSWKESECVCDPSQEVVCAKITRKRREMVVYISVRVSGLEIECSERLLILSVSQQSEHRLPIMVTHDPCPPRLVQVMYTSHVGTIRSHRV